MLIIYFNNGNVRTFVKAIEIISLTEIRAIDASTGEYLYYRKEWIKEIKVA